MTPPRHRLALALVLGALCALGAGWWLSHTSSSRDDLESARDDEAPRSNLPFVPYSNPAPEASAAPEAPAPEEPVEAPRPAPSPTSSEAPGPAPPTELARAPSPAEPGEARLIRIGREGPAEADAAGAPLGPEGPLEEATPVEVGPRRWMARPDPKTQAELAEQVDAQSARNARLVARHEARSRSHLSARALITDIARGCFARTLAGAPGPAAGRLLVGGRVSVDAGGARLHDVRIEAAVALEDPALHACVLAGAEGQPLGVGGPTTSYRARWPVWLP